MQPSREAFFCALSVNMVRLCCFVVFTMVKRPVGFGVLIGFGSLVGGIARLGTGKKCAWYMIAAGQSTCKRRLLKRSANTRGTFYGARSKELTALPDVLRSQSEAKQSQVRSIQGKYTSATSLVACEVEDTGFLRTWAGPWWSRWYLAARAQTYLAELAVMAP